LLKYLSLLLIFFSLGGYAQGIPPITIDSAFANIKTDSLASNYEDKKEFVGAIDTTSIELRKFSEADVNKLKTDPDLIYTQPPTVAESLWDRFKRWINWLLSNVIYKATTTDLGIFILYLLAAGAIIAVIMLLLKVNAFRVFYSGSDQGKQSYQVFHENIHEMDFDTLIREATERNEYRLATRLIFLYALKILSDKQLIDFKPGKTNHDYVEELQKGDLKTGLNELSFYFDYAWYGNFSINENQFQKVKQTFTFWKDKV